MDVTESVNYIAVTLTGYREAGRMLMAVLCWPCSYACIISLSAVIGDDINIHQAAGEITVIFTFPVATFVHEFI